MNHEHINEIVVIRSDGYRLTAHEARLSETTNTHRHVSKTSLNLHLVEHFLKCRLTVYLPLKSLPHKPQQNCLYSECTDAFSILLPYRIALDITTYVRLHIFMSK